MCIFKEIWSLTELSGFPGRHVGRARPGGDGTVRVELRWPEPFGGEGADVFRLAGPDTLSVASHLVVHGQTSGYTTLYRRKL